MHLPKVPVFVNTVYDKTDCNIKSVHFLLYIEI